MTAPPSPIHTGRRLSLQKLLVALLVIVFGWLLWSRFAEIDSLLHTLQSGRPLWVGLAIVMQTIYFTVFAASYWSAFDTVGVRTRMRDLIGLVFAATFINTTINSAGTAGNALFIDDVRRHGQSPARAAAGVILVIVTDYIGFALLLTSGLILLIRQHDLTRAEGSTALIMYFLIFAMAALLSVGLWAPARLTAWLVRFQKQVNQLGAWVHRPNLLAPDWATKSANDFVAAGVSLKEHPVGVVRTVGIAFLAHICDFATLYLLLHAFNQPLSISLALALYVMTILFTVISPTPSGAGIVETVMPAVYASLSVPLEAGTVINLAFRGISFWLPVLIGFFAMRRYRSLI